MLGVETLVFKVLRERDSQAKAPETYGLRTKLSEKRMIFQQACQGILDVAPSARESKEA